MDQPARVVAAAASSSAASSQVRVIVRARPLLPHEAHLASEAAKCVQISNGAENATPSVRVNEQLSDSFGKESQNETVYTFDGVYDSSISQQSLFDREILPNVSHRIWSGQTASLFAYGMTGTGKSHTMNGRDSDPGIIPRTVQHLFEELQDRVACDEQEWATTFVHVSAFELYNEKIYDLLKPATVSAAAKPLDRNAPDSSVNKEPGGDLPVREDATGKVFVAGLHESKINSYEQFQAAYALAMKNRKIASTKFNATSSRAHTMILLKIEFKSKKQPQKKITGRLQLLDLAGNEDNRFSGNTGSKGRMVESCKINNSLFVLGKVINALNAGETRIPYRDSKLTRLLAAGLGGSNYALMICCISPNPSHVVWTQRTLSFAMKSRQVVNVVEKNVQEGPTAAQIAEEERKNDLKLKLEQWKKEHNRPTSAAALPSGPVKTAKRILPGGTVTSAAPMTAQQVNVTVNKTVTDPSLLKKINSLTQDMHAMKTALQKQQQLHLRPGTAPTSAAAASIPNVSHAPSVPLTPMSSATLARSSVEKAKVYEKCGQFLMALNEYREVARIRPGNEKLQLKIAQVEAKVARMESANTTTSAAPSNAGMKRPLDMKSAATTGINKHRKLSPVSKKTILEEEEEEEEEEYDDEEEEEEEEEAYEDSDASDYDPMEDEETAEELWMKRNKGTRASRAAARANSKETSPITSPTSTSLLQRVTNSCATSTVATTATTNSSPAMVPKVAASAPTARASKSPVLPSKPLTSTPPAPAPVSSRTPLASLNSASNKSSSPTVPVAKTKQSPIAPSTTVSTASKENSVAVNTVAPAKKQADAPTASKATKKATAAPPTITAAPAAPIAPLPPVTVAPAVLAPSQLLSSLVSGRDSLLKLLNDGTLKQLMELQTIGKKRAQLILSKREELGGYHTIADLCHIGLSETQVEQFTQRNLMSSMWSATQAVQMEE